MSTIVKNIHIFKNNKWTPIKRVYDGNTWKKMKGIFFEGEWYEIGATCVVMPDGCAINTTVDPRYDETSAYGIDSFGLGLIPGSQRGVGEINNGFNQIRNRLRYGSSTSEELTYTAMVVDMTNGMIISSTYPKGIGLSIRGVKDYTGSQSNGTILENDYEDGDGNLYDAVAIGEQLWTVKNLHTTKYQSNQNILNKTDYTDWQNDVDGAYCWYENDYTTWGQYYGGLYNWFAINNGLIDNNGYRVPSDADWTQLKNYLINTTWCNGITVTSDNVAQYLKSCRQVNHPLG
ncbi:MAG TPA: FISUMP domain-containing protein [Tissierellaceae bacterium]|nr:FISUMP domain-containing protein [Tissierellaceae bacterium]